MQVTYTFEALDAAALIRMVQEDYENGVISAEQYERLNTALMNGVRA